MWWTPDEWLEFVMVTVIAYQAARLTILSRAQKQEREANKVWRDAVSEQTKIAQVVIDQQEKTINEYLGIIKEQAAQIDELAAHLEDVKYLHNN